jgi:hypothetical protein
MTAIETIEFALNEIALLKCDAAYVQDCHVCNSEEALKSVLEKITEEKISAYQRGYLDGKERN